MKTSLKGVLEIAEHEGIVPAPYLDSRGIPTYGVGHTASAGKPNPAHMPKGMPKDLEKGVVDALRVFQKDLAKYEKRVNDAIKVPLKQHQFDALVSFDFNTGGIHRAKLTRAINARDVNASRHFFGWMRPAEIRKRRRAEERLFRTGEYDHNGNTIPVWRANADMRLRGVVKSMSGDEVLALMAEPNLAKPPFPRTPWRDLWRGLWA